MADDFTIGDCLNDYFRARMAAMTAARLHIGIGELDARALLFIAANPGIRPTALREHLGVTSAAITILIDRLVARDALRRDPDPDDRRASRLTATADLDAAPWDELVRFDQSIDAAAAAMATEATDGAMAVVGALLRATRESVQS